MPFFRRLSGDSRVDACGASLRNGCAFASQVRAVRLVSGDLALSLTVDAGSRGAGAAVRQTGAVSALRRIERRNAEFQQWESLLRNRTKRHRAGAFVVQGVRPLTLAVEADWPMRTLIRPIGTRPSAWAAQVWERAGARGVERVEMAPGMLAELGDRAGDATGDDTGDADETGAAPELVAILQMPADDLSRLEGDRPALVTVFDRPTQPGNIGNLQRSIDAFGGTGLVVTGHAADPYDPKAVRASTGSCFNVPTVRCPSPADVLSWVDSQRAQGIPLALWGTDEGGETGLDAVPLDAPIVLVIGNETRGMAAAWRQACDGIISIPMTGTASSLNAAVAGSIVLHAALTRRLTR